MGALDLNKVAIAMGKILKMLPELEEKGTDFFSLNDNMEEYYALAYMARVQILDIIERNNFMQNDLLPITIPLGIFKTRKENMVTALQITIGKIKSLTEEHNKLHFIVNDILRRGRSFDEFEAAMPEWVLNNIR